MRTAVEAKAYYYANHERCKEYRRNQYKKYKVQRYIKLMERREKLQRMVNELKNAPCGDCQGWFNPHCMEYDHRDPAMKRESIAHMVAQTYQIYEIMKEIKKCDLVCSNCHALRTWRQSHEC